MKKEQVLAHVSHESLLPFYQKDSRILILGSFPSVRTREVGFYYAHPSNRFFKILGKLFLEPEPKTVEERKDFLQKHHIALYDVIYSCDIEKSKDETITNVVPIDLSPILKGAKIQAIFTTGKKASDLYRKYLGKDNIPLPSSSGANAASSLEKLVESYRRILDFCD